MSLLGLLLTGGWWDRGQREMERHCGQKERWRRDNMVKEEEKKDGGSDS